MSYAKSILLLAISGAIIWQVFAFLPIITRVSTEQVVSASKICSSSFMLILIVFLSLFCGLLFYGAYESFIVAPEIIFIESGRLTGVFPYWVLGLFALSMGFGVLTLVFRLSIVTIIRIRR